ncbi:MULTISPECIES: YcgN family cysteine cluster protein [Aliagarivorans]|uniref:YcgN family cysteine cluster protein n=1 Tax=Aliagarivorans TaxID=882379 RepID=UPI00047AF82F|nr:MULTISPECIES: YcgN family cysteine cluster protein [Aliagarivorans]
MLEPEFWRSKTLAQMNDQEWEALCDGCGKCCLSKLIDEDTDELYFTNIACVLLNNKTCQCSDYPNRFAKVSDCVKITLDDMEAFQWLPTTCAYRRLVEGRDLPSWHPLLHKGKKSKMHQAGASIRGKVICESELRGPAQDYIVTWPIEDCE